MPLDLEARKPLKLCVLKFGSSVLQKPDDYARAAHEIYRHTRGGEKVVAVVSALQGETDALFGVGHTVGQNCSDRLMARLVRCGEIKSAALMGLALQRSGIPSAVLDPHEMGLKADGEPLDANLTGLDADRVLSHFESADVIVAPGFFGEGVEGPVTLGRGGTDLTAVEFAHWLGADRVRLIKDVDGVYTDDPARNPEAVRLDQLDYDEAAKVSRGLVQEKAIFRARDNRVVIEVAALGRPFATRIGAVKRRAGPVPNTGRLRVAVLGHGAVGAGVCSHLLAHPGRFELAPVLVRDPDKHARAVGDTVLSFTDDPADALANTPDIVVETMGGTGFARSLSQSVLRDGSHLVSANKAVVALDIDRLQELARQQGRQLRYSAAVGGGVPILELIDLLAANDTVLSVEGVMNGTCNFIFGQLRAGARLADAIAEAQRLGFAEADPSTDVDGLDAADKLAIIVRHAFGVTLAPDRIPCESLNDLDHHRIRAVNEEGLVFKQVARCTVSPEGQVEARVDIEALDPAHPLAGLVNEGNGFLVRLPHRTIAVHGKGAGRWPTAEAVFADIMDIQRAYLAGNAETSPVPENPLSHIRRISTGSVA
ncbi:homoserine dehydrogenase [Maricaulis sp.]|uniref:homoserine dehydrogenase n=1 Tax=Maricaulis sp. TaxID=1486257 RepID=UPI002607AA85|nr:homoserine dehydrogenase [Maricaulis sp.]